jgi:DNA (cytosine-5)-methyltransferase 1
MNAISVCDGISAASEACEGLDYNFLLLSEIECFPRSVLKQRHNAVDQRVYTTKDSIAGRPVLWGDFTSIRPRHIRRFHSHAVVDILFGGTPCQSYSVAGKRAGLDDPRGELSLEYALLAYRLGVRWFLWENVPGVFSSAEGKDFAAILSVFTGRVVEVSAGGWKNSGVIPEAGPGHFGIAWRVLDAQYAGVPQRRRRVFVVGHLGDWRRAAAVLFDRESLQGHPAPRRESGKDVAPTISARPSGGGGLGTDFDLDGGLISSTGNVAHCLNAGGMGRQDYETETLIAHALRAEGFDASEDGTGRGTPLVPVAAPLTGNAYADRASEEANLIAFSCKDHGADAGKLSPTLRSMGFDGSHANAGGQIAIAISGRARGDDGRGYDRPEHLSIEVASTLDGVKTDRVLGPNSMAVRRLTPRECERLQGFPDDYTQVTHRGKPAADSPRYKALGNSWAVPCVRWIAKRIKFVDSQKVTL